MKSPKNVIFWAFCALRLTDCANYIILYFDSCIRSVLALSVRKIQS